MRVETSPCLTKDHLNEEQYRILLACEEPRVHSFKEIRERALLSGAALSLNIDRLAQRQLVEKIVHPEHARRSSAQITGAGRDLIEQVREQVEHTHARIEERFGTTQTSMLKTLLLEFNRAYGESGSPV